MIVRVQILTDDGRVITEHTQDAFQPGGWRSCYFVGPIVQGDRHIWGFTYIPEPPPPDPADAAELRRLVARHFGG